MGTLKEKVIEYTDNRIDYLRNENQEIADRIVDQILGMSSIMAQEMKVVSANEYSASESYTLKMVTKNKSDDQSVLEELHRRLDFYYGRLQKKEKENYDSRGNNSAFEERGKGRHRGISETYQSLKAFMMRMVDEGMLRKIEGSKHKYECNKNTVV